MRSYLAYWPADRYVTADARFIWGGWNQATAYGHVETPCRIFLITAKQGLLYRLATARVTSNLTGAAIGELEPPPSRPPHACASRVLVVDGTPAFRFNVIVDPARLEGVRLLTSKGKPRPIKGLADGRLRHIESIHGCYAIDADSVDVFATASDPADAPAERFPDLLAALDAAPYDAQAAQVLADAWQSVDDPRGVVTRLELDWVQRRRGAKKALDAGLKEHRDACIGRPGGFPFSPRWGPSLTRDPQGRGEGLS
ncbi:MAG: hypothetical protein AAF211_16955 [Myxococcota bacterium]